MSRLNGRTTVLTDVINLITDDDVSFQAGLQNIVRQHPNMMLPFGMESGHEFIYIKNKDNYIMKLFFNSSDIDNTENNFYLYTNNIIQQKREYLQMYWHDIQAIQYIDKLKKDIIELKQYIDNMIHTKSINYSFLDNKFYQFSITDFQFVTSNADIAYTKLSLSSYKLFTMTFMEYVYFYGLFEPILSMNATLLSKIIHCQVCNKFFIQESKKARYCSASCRKQAFLKNITKNN